MRNSDAAINYLHSSIELQWHCFVTDNHFQTETLFQIISSLVEWIDGHAVLTEDEKKQYVSIVIAQLSSVEIQIFFLYSLKNYEKRMNLFTKYRFFKNLDSKQRALAFVKQYGMNANSYSSEAFDVF
ncbi:hypothetical protein UNDKW_3950 [Undibacterium sp. KW1]|uniref:putative phage abortive infection protein n=1 Tax=Undibacterium sp. KW1 TaxID=2058624 RepID=UPI001331FBD3|nr:putative phage abortive infection protein [Undibacterium sp. KW1]BBB62223.1 hypothetical protein UNDKW_3950 [Undibacterium sp. KW1]